MTVKVIVFDFDGTLADTFDAIVRITDGLAREFGYKPASPEDIVHLRNLTSREIIKQSGVSLFKLPFIMRKVKAELNNEIQSVSLVTGMREVLISLKEQGNQLGIITSNSKENVNLFLHKQGLADTFKFICSGTTLFGKNKIINNFLREEKLAFERVIYVGDETRDIEAAKRSKVKAIAVSWGFNSKEVLAKQNPDFLIDSPSQLIEVVESLQQLVYS
jgi:HAD superfamily hydrolase (TIGR01549 family)